MALDRATAILKLAAPIAEAVPILGTPVKSAFEATAQILEYAGAVKSNKEKTRELAEHAAKLFKGLKDRLDEMKNPSYNVDLERLREQVQAILSLLTDIKEWAQQQTRQSKLHRTWNKKVDLADIAKWRRKLDDVYQQFMMESQISLDRKISQVVSAAESEILMRLAPVFSAQYDASAAPPGCLDGTRVEVMRTLLAWCGLERSSLHIYWLAGHAGTGKSAIARTLSERLAALEETIVVTFFASKNSEDRRDLFRMLNSLVHQLAYKNLSIRSNVVEVLSSQPNIVQQPLNKRIKSLLLAPLQELIQAHSVVIVIDALDECASINGVEGGTLIHDLAAVLGSLPIKLVITSRKEPSLERMFAKLPSAERVELHEIEGSNVSSDVRLILEKGFEEIVEKHEISTIPWPSQENLDELIARTGRFIIFATTMLKFLDTDRLSPEDQLTYLLTHTSNNSDGDRFELVDELYLNVLETAARHSRDARHTKPALCLRIQALIGTVVLLYDPLSIPALAKLLGVHESDMLRDVRALSAVLELGPEKDGSGAPLVRIFHLSFRDFLLERCKDVRFSVNATRHHSVITISCLRLLNQSLRYDICDIKDPTIPHSEVMNPTLAVRLQKHVPEAVRYACQFWMNHIADSGPIGSDLLLGLEVFLSQHVLHWIEVLALTGKVSYVVQRLLDVSWTQPTLKQAREVELSVILNDTLRLLQAHWRSVETNALQIYYSGLIFMPGCALFNHIYGKEQIVASTPRLLSARPTDWVNDALVFDGHSSYVFSVAFSPNGRHIASGSRDNSVRLWDVQSGREVAIFEGHTNWVRSVTFSPDGRQIASGSDDWTVRIWDVQSEREISRFESHTGGVNSVAFSPDGKHLASGSDGKTVQVRVDYAHSEPDIRRFEGHTDSVCCVAFSPDGIQIASGSQDHTIRLWNMQSGQEVSRFEGHTKVVWSVAFSPDGREIASGLNDNTVKVWNAHSGQKLVTYNGHSREVTSVAFSHDGSQIVSGSVDRTVQVWDAKSGHEVSKLEGHTDWVRSVAFSPDGKQIASGSYDRTVRLWDAHSGSVFSRYTGHVTAEINTLHFSPNGRYIAAGSDNNTVRVWDAQSGQEIHILEGHTDKVNSVAFSPDGRQIASGSEDSTVRIWDVQLGREIGVFKGHDSLVLSVAFSLDGMHVVSGSADRTVRLRNTHSGDEIHRVGGHTDEVNSVALSPNGKQIASGSDDKTVRLWDAQSGQEIYKCEGHTRLVRCVAFSPDGRQIASGSNDWTVRLWDTQSGHEMAKLEVSARIRSLEYVNDGLHIKVRFYDESVRIWSIAYILKNNSEAAHDILLAKPASESQPPKVDDASASTSPMFLGFMYETGWIVAETSTSDAHQRMIQLCLLPVELRGRHFATYDGKRIAIVSASTQQLVIIDMEPMLDRLRHIGVMQVIM